MKRCKDRSKTTVNCQSTHSILSSSAKQLPSTCCSCLCHQMLYNRNQSDRFANSLRSICNLLNSSSWNCLISCCRKCLKSRLIKYSISVQTATTFTIPTYGQWCNIWRIQLKLRMNTTPGEKGMWPLLSISSSQLKTCKGTTKWQKNSVKLPHFPLTECKSF